MLKKILIGFSVAALAMASAAETYRVRLLQTTVLNGAELKAGDYKVIVDGDKAVFQQGKQKAEAPVKVEKEGKKYESTIFKFDNSGGVMHLIEIRMAGTNTRLVFSAD